MPNTINNQNLFLDTQFQQFVQFAEGAVAAGKEKAVARLSESELGGIVTRTIKPTSADWVGVGAGRLSSLKKANNTTREAFMKAVAEMFGGEDHIPGSVKDAMKLEDYGKGRPLTARRILAVKAAIDNDGTYAKLVGSFRSTDSAHVAQRLGWLPSEMPKLARAARYLSAITGEAEVESIERLSTPGTKENRLLNYGGRFLESAGNFKNGMRLLDTFKDWFAGVNDALVANGGEWADRKEGMSPTLLNAKVACFTPNMRLGFEKFVFEYIAQDPAFDLAEKDATRLFGMENNVASHFFGRYLNQSCTQAIAQIPPERRKTFFKAVTMFFPVVHTAEDANKKPKDRGEPRDNKIVVARVLKNLDKIEELEARGELTFKNLAKVCVPELPEDSAFEFREVGKALSDVADNVMPEIVKRKLNLQLLVPVLSTLQETGCSLDEAIESVNGGKPQPLAPYMTSGTLGLDAFDGTTKAGRKRLESDLVRPFGYTDVKRGKVLIPDNKSAFRFRFPGEDPIATDSSAQGKKNIGTVIDKIEAMCGKLRPRQASNVMTMVSQSALAILRGGLSIYGIDTNEHGGCDFTLSKNEKTGEILIRYSSPEELPFSFEWTATVGLDGSVTSTPMRFTEEKTRNALREFQISGKAANEIGRFILPGSGLTDVENPGQELKSRMKNIATASIQTYATKSIAGMRGANGGDIDFDKYPSAFTQDINRHLPIRIGDGPLLDTLGGPEKARDEYVKFITDGKVETYAEADRKTKIKACLLMAFSCQGMLSCGLKGVSNAFDANGNVPRLMASKVAGDDSRKDSVNFSKDENGNIVIKTVTEFTSGLLSLTDENLRPDMYATNKGSSIKYDFNVVLTKESLEKFADADWPNFDSQANRKIENDTSVPHSTENAAQALPEDLRLDLDVNLSFSIDVAGIAKAV